MFLFSFDKFSVTFNIKNIFCFEMEKVCMKIHFLKFLQMVCPFSSIKTTKSNISEISLPKHLAFIQTAPPSVPGIPYINSNPLNSFSSAKLHKFSKLAPHSAVILVP